MSSIVSSGIWKVFLFKGREVRVITIASIKEHVKKCEDAWNRGSISEVVGLYSKNVSFLTPIGGLAQGRVQLQKLYDEVYPSRNTMGLLSNTVGQCRIGADGKMASAVVRWRLFRDEGNISGKRGYSLLVFGIEEGKMVVLQDASFSVMPKV